MTFHNRIVVVSSFEVLWPRWPRRPRKELGEYFQRLHFWNQWVPLIKMHCMVRYLFDFDLKIRSGQVCPTYSSIPHPPCIPKPQSAYLCPRCLCCIPPYHHHQGRKMKIFSLAFFVTPECHTPLQCQRSMNSNLSFRAISKTKVSKLLPLYPILTILYPILTILLSQLHQF